MLRFSQRKGLTPIRTEIQKDGIDDDLKNRLWSLLHEVYLSHTRQSQTNEWKRSLWRKVWDELYKWPTDSVPASLSKIATFVRDLYFKAAWGKIYDLIEYCANNYGGEITNKQFITQCNEVLKEELSAFRFVDGVLTEISSEEEIKEIEEASTVTEPVREHIVTALKHLSNKEHSDYRNSIKESISAVESYCKFITKQNKATLGQALNVVEKTVSLHPSLKAAFQQLYHYTSDADGIRHALMDLHDLDFEDAKYMLVSCSAFINYLKEKYSKIDDS